MTGTAKQAVANDYNLRLYRGMDHINIEYGKLIDEKIKQLTNGGYSKLQWKECI